MKKRFVFCLILYLLLLNNAVFAQSSGSNTSTVTDEDVQAIIQELKATAVQAKQTLSQYPAGVALLNKLANVQKKLFAAIENVTPEKCSEIYNSALKRLDALIASLEKKGCNEVESRLSINSSTSKKCIPQNTLDPIVSELKSISESLKSVGEIDLNRNGIPDFCEVTFSD